jgi:LAS superfamily LD-carboxypeptidase LdcB
VEGIAGAMARISALENQLSTLRAPAAPFGQFGALLERSMTAPATAAPTATPAASAAWSAALRPAALQSPPDISSYGNGRIPASALTSIGGEDRLQAPAAEAFLSMRSEAAKEGIELPVNDSYRSLPEQVEMAERKGLYSEGGWAAEPGTSSHGLGLSVDLQLDGGAQRWMRDNAGRFGFVEDVAREPWHWTFKP